VKTTLERELKLDAEPDFSLPDLRGKPLAPRIFTSTYYDTADRRLLRAGITLRRRVESRVGAWQLKLPSDEGRYELEERGGAQRPPKSFLRLLQALLRGGVSLEPVAKLRTRRAGVAVGDRSSRVEVVVDTVAVLEGKRVSARFVEVEAEVVAGDGKELRPIERALRAAGARKGEGVSKIRRVLADELKPQPPADGDPLASLRRLLVAQYEAILANDPGVRLGRDVEALHQLRVATRRARALLRAAKGLVAPQWAEPLREELRWLGALLGPVRDLDVMLEHLDEEESGLSQAEDLRAFRRLRRRLAAERDEARTALLQAMETGRYFALLDALEGAAAAPGTGETIALDEIAAGAFAQLRKDAWALAKRPADDELHRIRIQAKRARYAAELAEPVLKKPGTRLIARAKRLQDVIGDHQDACVAEARLRSLAARGGGATGLVAGRLVERQRQRKRAARRAYPDAWRRLEQAGRKAF
jgi:CHAD domain-containing protein